MIKEQYRQIAFIISSLFVVGIGLIGFRVELGAYLSVTMFLGFIILALHWLLIGLWGR